MATRKPGTTARPSGGAKSRDKGTRGGRPEASAAAGQRQGKQPARQGRPGNGQARMAGQAQRGRTAPAAAAVEPSVAATPAWLQWTTWVLSLGGLGVAIYLTIAHFNTSAT